MSDLSVDDIARAMTDIEAPADLRARVLADIGRPQARRWPSVALPLAAAASIAAVAIVGMRPFLTEREVPAVPGPSLVQRAAADPAPDAIASISSAAPAQRPVAAISADELAWQSRRPPALEERALTLEPIQPPPASIAPISVEPIALEPILVPPPGAGSGDRR